MSFITLYSPLAHPSTHSARTQNLPNNPIKRMVKSILNSAYYEHVVKQLEEKTLHDCTQECLSVQDVEMTLYPC